MSKRKTYDYIMALSVADSKIEYGRAWKRILRKLVREAVEIALYDHDPEIYNAIEAQRIAKKLLP